MIAGYNTASRVEKDRESPCRFVGKLMFALTGCWLVAAASEVFQRMFLLWLGLGLVFLVTIAALIYANTGNRFQKKQTRKGSACGRSLFHVGTRGKREESLGCLSGEEMV